MKESDTISVLLCVHSSDNEHDVLLQRALESLVRQTYDKFDVVVVMDECWEYTKSIVSSYNDVLSIRTLERPRKQGLAHAKNYGIPKCTGDWIAFLDADDEWMDCKLEIQREFMLENPDVSFCGTNVWDHFDGKLYPNCFKTSEYMTHDQIAARIMQENVMCHGSMVIRKIALESLGNYNTDKMLLGREDWELWQRAVSNGFKFAKVPERLYIYSMGTSVER